MISNRMSALALSAAVATLWFAAPAMAAKFDGNWNMVLVTTNGHCGVIKMGMAVNGGHISATSGKFVSAQDCPGRPHFRLRRDQDQWCGRPAPGRRHRTVHTGQGQWKVERHRAFGRLRGRLDCRPYLVHPSILSG